MKTLTAIASAAVLALACAQGARAQTSITYLENSKAWSSVVADFDRDGHDDLFVEGHDGGEDRIWYWTPAGYLPAPFTFPSEDRHACVAADVNRDGLLDLYCAIGAERRTALKANELWIQQPGGKWVAQSNFGAESASDSSRYPLFLDLNHDGYPDLYSSSEDVPRSDGLPDTNHFYLNNRDSTFTEITTLASGDKGWKCVSKGDVDGDGWDDLLVCSQAGDAQIYVNNHANDFTLLASPAISQWRDAKLVDMNGDGRDDLVVVDWNNKLSVYLNTGSSPYYV
ncbi:MAG TPA: VCBS repeat-containing protein, partial [Burkholderiaceae bacterium]